MGVVKMDLKDEIAELYEKWLLNKFPDEIHNKEDLINKSCDGHRYDEFLEELKKSL